jgi:dihydroxy-acid dehydratase
MDPENERQQFEPEEPRFLNFPSLPDDAKDAEGKLRLNKYSATITRGHDFPGAQVRLNRISLRFSCILT